ncbi:MAG: TolC family protein [Dysgonamonadaceae bacterium]|jgi:outer membrane protein TolC|nr:TolC family protein [Dysgonamonadaceae bacterium]
MKKFLVFILLINCCIVSANNNTLTFNLQQVVELAQQQSPDVLRARHSFRSSYWNYVYYKANYLPSLTFNSTPIFNRMINPITLSDGTSQFVQQNQLRSNAGFEIRQNIPLTGGNVFIRSSLERLDLFLHNTHSYRSVPMLVGYQQSLLGFNELKWDKKIEPLRYEEGKRRYVEALELVGTRAVSLFFNLARAQTDLEIAQTNLANADTLYVFAQGRYNIGTITENEMLQLEISKLMEESNRLEAQMQLDDSMDALRAFLGITETLPIEVIVESEIPLISIDAERALTFGLENSRDMLTMERRLQESESDVAQARANAGLRVDLYMQFGLAQIGSTIGSAYQNTLNQQYVELGVRLPILDWGRGRGQVQMARSNRDLVQTQVEQDRINFEMNIQRLVKQFNLQSNQLIVAEKVAETAERRNEVARRLFMLGRSSILDLNASIAEKDAAKRTYISTLFTYWQLHYMIRSITLFDFEKNISITEDYQLLIR